MKMTKISALIALIFFFCSCLISFAQEPTIVGIKEAPPFAFKDSKGKWMGITVDLWKEIKLEKNAEFEPREMALDKLLIAIESGEIATGLGAISILYDREKKSISVSLIFKQALLWPPGPNMRTTYGVIWVH